MPASIPSVDQLKRAIEISERIAELESELKAILHGSDDHRPAGKTTPADTSEKAVGAKRGRKKAKRQMSPEARERIAAAQRARWAKAKA